MKNLNVQSVHATFRLPDCNRTTFTPETFENCCTNTNAYASTSLSYLHLQ